MRAGQVDHDAACPPIEQVIDAVLEQPFGLAGGEPPPDLEDGPVPQGAGLDLAAAVLAEPRECLHRFPLPERKSQYGSGLPRKWDASRANRRPFYTSRHGSSIPPSPRDLAAPPESPISLFRT